MRSVLGKGLAGGARHARSLPLLGAVLWVCALVSAALGLLDPSAATLAAYAVTTIELAWMARRVGRFHWVAVVLFPLALTAFVGLFAWSLVQRGVRGRVTWRGRQIEVR